MGLQYYKNEIGKFQVQTCHFTRIKSYHFEKRVVVLQEESWKKEKFFFTLYEDFILVSLLKSTLTALAHVWFGCNHCCTHNRQQTGQWDAAVDGGSGVTCGLIATDCSCVSWLRAPRHLPTCCRDADDIQSNQQRRSDPCQDCFTWKRNWVFISPFFPLAAVGWAMPPAPSCDCPHLDCVGEITKEELIHKSHVSHFVLVTTHYDNGWTLHKIQCCAIHANKDVISPGPVSRL